MPGFDYQGALDAGYSDDEIRNYITSKHSNFDMQGALDAGYSPQEVSDYLYSKPKEERSTLEQAGRIGTQFGLGVLQGTPAGIAYDIATLPSSSKGFATSQALQSLGENVEFLLDKNYGKSIEEWPKEDRELYEDLKARIQNPQKVSEEVKTGPDISIRGLTEKVTGADLTPEGIAEKAAQWTGFIKDPKKIFELGKTALTLKDVVKAIAPNTSQTLRGASAGTALQLAEEGEYGPIGTMAAAVIGDIGGNVGASIGKKAAKIVTNPREALAEIATKFTKNDKLDLQKQIIQDFRDSGIQADIGTLTNSDLVKWVQSRLAQSGLTGPALDELKKLVTEQIKEEYKQIADSVGTARFATSHEAGEVSKSFLKQVREADLAEARDAYKSAEKSLKKDAFVNSNRLVTKVKEIESALEPGQIKSAEQKAVLDTIEKLKRDITDSSGNPIGAKVKDLMNNKIALNDIINYEVQGGQKQLLKGLVSELDRAIISHGRDNAKFAKDYIRANKRFSNHAKTFRNKRVTDVFGDKDPAAVLNKMNSVQGIRDIEQMVKTSPQGKEIIDSLKRYKLDRMIEDNFIDGITQQIKLGTFSKLLDKGKNREIISALVPSASLKRLKKLQKNSGQLADTAQKFLNTSKTGITLEDAGVVSKMLWDMANVFSGNPWPFIRTGAGIAGARYLTKLMGDPEFLKLVEEMILASEKNNTSKMDEIGKLMIPAIRAAMNQEKEQ